MLEYSLRRLLLSVPVVFVSTVAIFGLLHLLPGDPAVALGGAYATPQQIAAIRHAMGLDQPLPVQYVLWLGRLLHGNFGSSAVSGQPVGYLLASRIPATLELALAALLLALCFALPTGIWAAVHQGRAVDWIITVSNTLGIAIPNFWVGILAIVAFSVALGWLPPGGRVADSHQLALTLKSLLLPALTLSLLLGAALSRFVKASMLEVLYDDYIRTARAKGLASPVVVIRHAVRNAMLPTLTVLGLQVGSLLGGTVIIESIFAWPGLGNLLLDAINNRDYVVVQAGLLYLVLLYVVLNLLTDVLYGLLDPRLRFSK
ncbi:MAG: ABC transporter permease [Chloroflexota bacterium]|nr:ABC transporter permease [Chloroflexota bacterium]